MKKLLLPLLLALACRLGYADTKISAMGSTTTLNTGDIIPVVTNPSGTAANKSITKSNLTTTLDILTNASASTTFSAIGVSSASLQTQVNSLNTSTATIATSTASLQTQVNNLNTSTATIATSTASLQTQVNSLNTSTATIATSTASLQTQVSTLSTSTSTLKTQIETKVNYSSFSATSPITYNNATGGIGFLQTVSSFTTTSTFTVTFATINLNGVNMSWPSSGTVGNYLQYTATNTVQWGSVTAAASSSGSSPLAVATGTASAFGTVTSSPTAVINLSSSSFTTQLTGVATAYIDLSANVKTRALGVSWDGSGSVLTTGTTYWLSVPSTGTIVEMVISGLASGSATVNVSSSAVFNTNPVSICASACPTLTSGTIGFDTTLTGWAKSLAKDSFLYFVVNSATTISQLTVALEYQTP